MVVLNYWTGSVKLLLIAPLNGYCQPDIIFHIFSVGSSTAWEYNKIFKVEVVEEIIITIT